MVLFRESLKGGLGQHSLTIFLLWTVPTAATHVSSVVLNILLNEYLLYLAGPIQGEILANSQVAGLNLIE